MANIGIGFQLSASAVGMSQGINAGVVELQKLGYTAKQTARDVATLRTIEISRAFIGSVQAIASSIGQANRLLSGFVAESVAISEAAQRSNIVFGESADAIQRFAQSSSAIGLSEKAAIQAATRFGTLFTTIGLVDKQAAEYSETLVRLAADLASFSDSSVDDALTAISSALVGEFEPIRRFGVLLNEATLKQTALQQGLKVTTGTLDPQTKLLASYAQILRQTNKQQGDFERNSALLANQQRVLSAEWNNVRATIGEALQPAYAALVASLRDSLPQIREAGKELASFVGQLDYGSVIAATVSAFSSLGGALGLVTQIAAPLANNLLPAIGGYLAFINRQAIAGGIAGLARFFAAAAASALGYAGAAGTAATATAALGVSIRKTLASTGIGVLVVGLGLLAGAAIEWAIASKQANADVVVAVQQPDAEVKKLQSTIQAATADTVRFGERVKDALRVPEINRADFAQDSLGQAESAFKRLAEQLGGLARVPQEIVTQFAVLIDDAERANREVGNQQFALQEVDQAARDLALRLNALTEARNRDSEAAKRANEEARKLAQDNRSRVAELATQGLPAAEQSRLQLNRDLLAITREHRAAEEALASARRSRDANAIAAAYKRLDLAKAATLEAKKQDRQRQIDALGIDQNLLKPTQSLADQFKAVRTAFDRKLIDGGEARDALRNLAAEGIQIRAEIITELSRPIERALQVSDVRTNEGISQFFGAGRQDPAVDQRRQQLAKLEEIRRGLESIGVRPVEILG